ncbi:MULTISPECIES: helix-turn-helix domain-containing protein [unclassified Agrococcus]|uniref:helix-turn-helix domain-containing protein n=1 Tax=unclassified Agrococcus TaxID=2615065 RepID=UPI00360852D1
MSRRTFAPAFRASTGTTSAAWVRSRRLDGARRLLETTDRPVDRIADACGLGSAVTLRQGFGAAFGTTPSACRHRFDARVRRARRPARPSRLGVGRARPRPGGAGTPRFVAWAWSVPSIVPAASRLDV